MTFKMLIFSLLLIINITTATAQRGTITIQFSGTEPGDGLIQLGVFNEKQGFPIIAPSTYKTYQIPVNSDQSIFEITDLPYGEYAISCFQDRNGNKKLDINFFGIPKEKTGASNNPPMGAIPTFEDSRFSLSVSEYTLTISMN